MQRAVWRACWNLSVPDDVARRRAGGRRRYNAWRRADQEARRDRVAELILATWPALLTQRGWQTRTARTLGVDRATICRDVDAILEDMSGPMFRLSFDLLRALLAWGSKRPQT